MSNIVEKLRKSREKVVAVGGFEFTVRRPTDVEAARLRGVVSTGDLIPFVVGWNKVRQMDVLPSGGDGHPLAFDADICREWLSDRPDLLQPLVDEIVAAYRAHTEALKEKEKN